MSISMNGNGNSGENDLDCYLSDTTFDPSDESSWHFGEISREDVVKILDKEPEDGVFLVRDSTTSAGNLVLSVKESGNGKEQPISHYLIEVKRHTDGNPLSYCIGEQPFMSMSQLLSFYKTHYLESTPLTRPAPRKLIRVRAKFDFNGQDNDDLPFKRNETLHVIKKDPKNDWWTARNSLGQCGQIPANYVEECPSDETSPRNSSNNNVAFDANSNHNQLSNIPAFQKQLPAIARVKMARTPNAYDKSALRLEVGDRVKVLKMDSSGTWEGELNGKIGQFPFTYVEWEDETQSVDKDG